MKQKIAFAFIMGLITTFIISFVLIAINIGFGDRFIAAWLRSWTISYLLAVTAILFISPKVQERINKFFSSETPAEEEPAA